MSCKIIFVRNFSKLKIAIVYSTLGGTTRECAELLSRELKNQSVSLFEIGKEEPNASEFDVVVVGFPVIMGKAHKPARVYMKKNKEALLASRAAYYVCCGFVDCFEEYAEKCIPAILRESAVDVSCLGGSLDPSRFKGINKLIVRSVRNEILGGGDNGDERKDMVLPTIMEENIAQMADKIKKIKE